MPASPDIQGQIEKLRQAIAAQEDLRQKLGDEAVNASIAVLGEKLAELQAQPAQPGRLRKQVTVLFADVSGFTAMSERMDAEEVGEMMNAVWEQLDTIIVEHGGAIDKHIGDAVMALWGAAAAREDDPQQAVRAALAIQQSVNTFTRASHDAPPLQMRTGINTGPVLLGEVGTAGEFTAMGDTVNLASRLEHAAPVGGILISYDTYRHVRGMFDVQQQQPLEVKGKAEPVRTYVVVGARERAFRMPTRGVEGIETRMVGREAQFQQLRFALRTTIEQRRPQLVTLVGEAGVGKSRLLFEFEQWLGRQPEHVTIFKGRASQEMMALPYSLLRDLFAFRYNIKESDGAQAARDKLETALTNYVSEEYAHFMGHLMGFDYAGSPHISGILSDPQQIRDRAFTYASRFFAAVTADGPAALFLEDIHWADEGSLDMLAFLVNALDADVPLLVVALSRPSLFAEREIPWLEGHSRHTQIDLQALPAQATGRLVSDILQKVEKVPPDLHNLIVNGAEGNPFYVEELIKMLADDGVIVTGAEVWQVEMERLKKVKVPATLTGVVQARLDRLPDSERETLQHASVVGRIFWDETVAHIGGEAREDTDARLDALEGRELIFGREESAIEDAREFIFKHAVLRDVTYESVLLKLRKVYHRQVADWLVERSGERVSEHLAVIAGHYELAGDTAQAGQWYARAAQQAKDTYATQAAIGYYRKALNYLQASAPAGETPATAELFPLYQGLGTMFRYGAQYEESDEVFTAMRETAEGAADAAALSRAWIGVGQSRILRGEHRAALEVLGQAEEAARAAGPLALGVLGELLPEVLVWKCLAYANLEDAESVFPLVEEALALSRSDALRAGATLMLAHAYGLAGDLEKDFGLHEEVLAVAREMGDQRYIAPTLTGLGQIAGLRGDYHAAVRFFGEALSNSHETGSRLFEATNLAGRGGVRAGRGEYDAAEADLRRAISMAEDTGSAPGLGDTYRYLAETLLGQGKADEALAAARQALELEEGQEAVLATGAVWRVLGLIAGQTQQPVMIAGSEYDAPACFAESLRILKESKMEVERAHTLLPWARHELEKGDVQRGEEMWREARIIFERVGADKMVERMDAAR